MAGGDMAAGDTCLLALFEDTWTNNPSCLDPPSGQPCDQGQCDRGFTTAPGTRQ